MSQRPIRLILWVFVALFASLTLASCDLSAQKKVEIPKVKRPNTKTEATKATSIKVPGSWPKQIPMYPYAELMEASTTPTGGLKLFFRTGDSADKIFAWYYDTMLEQKWNMSGPTLDVAQNIAIIKSELEDVSFLIDARRFRNDKGESEGSSIILTAPAPKVGF